MTLRILFVATPESVHTARWIGQLRGLGWDIHVFPVTEHPPHQRLTGVTLHTFSRARTPGTNPGLRVKGPYPFRSGRYLMQLAAKRAFPGRMRDAARLAAVIRRVRPNLIHSLGVQNAAYLTLEAKHLYGEAFPRWMVSSWGNDLHLFGRLTSHAPRVREVLANCDYFTADCARDLELARTHGFQGETFPELPGAGGFDIEAAQKLRSPGLTSARRIIAVKGYQGSYGRALDGLRAVELCADALRGYTVVVYFSSTEVSIAAELMSQRTGITTEIFPNSSYEDSLRLHGRARVSLAVSISDGLPLSTMEAALMGSFPVQTNTGCVGDHLKDGLGTLLVSPDDPAQISVALRRAVTDDVLVNRAAEINLQYIAENLSDAVVRPQVIAMYEKSMPEGA